jgi:hypothetical protein
MAASSDMQAFAVDYYININPIAVALELRWQT